MSFHLSHILAIPTTKELTEKVKRLIVSWRRKHKFMAEAAGYSALSRKIRGKDNVDKGNS